MEALMAQAAELQNKVASAQEELGMSMVGIDQKTGEEIKK